MKKKLLMAAALVTVTGLSAAAMYGRRGTDVPSVTTSTVSRGAILTLVSATGTLEAVDTVQVGTQVSGMIQSLGADFNSIVTRGQVLARLDPSLIQADIERAKANLAGAEADVERLQVQLNDASVKLARTRELASRDLIAKSDLDAAVLTERLNQAQVKAATAQVTQARAALSQAEVNLQKTVITSPIDGIVISRSVELGQTVAASLQAPTLYTIAADLRRMQLKANIDESDLGSIAAGQPVTFRVDAYPTDVFRGRVEQVRLNPVIEQNVVTYAAIISAPNAELKLKPGMTATLSVEVANRQNVLRVPSAALRFKPTSAVLSALGQPTAGAGASVPRTVGTTGNAPKAPPAATLWVSDGEQLRPVTTTTGVSDGTLTEVVSGDLKEGDTVVTMVTLPGSTAATRSTATSNPLMGPTGPRR